MNPYIILFLSGLFIGLFAGTMLAYTAKQFHARPVYVYMIWYRDLDNNEYSYFIQSHIPNQQHDNSDDFLVQQLSDEDATLYMRGLL